MTNRYPAAASLQDAVIPGGQLVDVSAASISYAPVPFAGVIVDAFATIAAAIKRWTHAEIEVQTIFPAFSPGMTLADIAALYPQLNQVPYPFGSRVWQGGAPGLAAIGADGRLSFFAGQSLEATVQTGLFQPVPGRRAFVNGFRALDDAVGGAGRVAVCERPQTASMWLPPGVVNEQSLIPARASGRYMRFERTVPAGADWNDLNGIDFDADNVVADGGR